MHKVCECNAQFVLVALWLWGGKMVMWIFTEGSGKLFHGCEDVELNASGHCPNMTHVLSVLKTILCILFHVCSLLSIIW